MSKININGIYRDMTAEEEAELEKMAAEMQPELSSEEKLKAIEAVYESTEDKLTAIEKIYEEAES